MSDATHAAKAAITVARENNNDDSPINGKAIVTSTDDMVEVEFRGGVGLAAEKLIREHAFKIAPHSANGDGVTLYKRK